MGHYVHYIGGGIVDSKIYETGNAAKSFKSPMKELNEQTVLIENAKTIGFESNDEYNEIMFLREITHTINAVSYTHLCCYRCLFCQ